MAWCNPIGVIVIFVTSELSTPLLAQTSHPSARSLSCRAHAARTADERGTGWRICATALARASSCE
eukprot:9359602-Pyramimonas_sp.AAC.1